MRNSSLFVMTLLIFSPAGAIAANAQQSDPAKQAEAPPPVQQAQPAPQPTPAAQATQPPGDKKTRVYVTDSQSWQVSGGWGAAGGSGGGTTQGGARPQTAEIIKTFRERCSDLTVTNNKDKANYVVILDHEGGKGALSHKNKVAVFNRDGDSIFSHSTMSLGNSVKDACEAIRKDAGMPSTK
jgi:hypothetical protein